MPWQLLPIGRGLLFGPRRLLQPTIIIALRHVPLAQRARRVTGGLQDLGHGRIEHRAATGCVALQRCEVGPVLASEQGGARRCAPRATGIGVGEHAALRGQTVNVRRGEVLLPETTEVPIRQVVRQYENNVGPLRSNRNGLGAKEQSDAQDCEALFQGFLCLSALLGIHRYCVHNGCLNCWLVHFEKNAWELQRAGIERPGLRNGC